MYSLQDRILQGRGVDTAFFAAAAGVTQGGNVFQENAIGALDSPVLGVNLLANAAFGSEAGAFLRQTNAGLYDQVNVPAFLSLANGGEVAGLEGLRAHDLDRGFVGLEQTFVTQQLDALDPGARDRIVGRINAVLNAPVVPIFVNDFDPLRTTLNRDFPGGFDFGSEADRIRLGTGIVLRTRYSP